ncbi:PREDICTED: rhamnose-binding lectin-like [Acropora digitifera]|uniref:rhamnose-binding lectin-like n=1 Tax=Acropora digitifera TaxID=70779 RepID=UPI00077A4258|nr:PREDICTED: rhamnose-binding lectin-like [Acropora digitifera]
MYCLLLENVTSVTICEHERQTISCEGGETISVLEASYGKHDRETCPKEPIRTTNCSAGSSLSVVQSSCNDQASCNLFASNSVFGDPCFGTVKYLQVKYECIEAPDPCDSDPCQNGGTCTNLGDNNFECECAPGFGGDICEEENVTSVTICEHERQTISCEGGATISVLEASYGRHDRKTCPKEPIRTTNCSAGSSLSVVQSSCNDQASCNLFASNSVFGDPCFGTVKYLQVKYECIEAPDPCDSDPCQNGGTCTNLGDNNFECECAPGFGGDICEEENVTSVTICEHERQTISCEGGATISVLEASYGRHDRKTCPKEPIRTTNCSAGSSLSVVQSSCNDQASCNLFASNSVFGDPCFGTVKYLQVKYECIEAPDPCDSDPCQNGGTCTNLGDNNFESLQVKRNVKFIVIICQQLLCVLSSMV